MTHRVGHSRPEADKLGIFPDRRKLFRCLSLTGLSRVRCGALRHEGWAMKRLTRCIAAVLIAGGAFSASAFANVIDTGGGTFSVDGGTVNANTFQWSGMSEAQWMEPSGWRGHGGNLSLSKKTDGARERFLVDRYCNGELQDGAMSGSRF